MKMTTIRFAFCFGILFLAMLTNAQAQNEELKLEILNGHSGGGVLAVAVSSDGKFALTGSTDQTALLWDLDTGKQLRRFVGHEDSVSAVQFSRDGSLVLTAGHDGAAYLWRTATGERVRGFGENRNGVLVKHTGKILSAAISSDGRFVATAGEDKTARIWDLSSGKQVFELKHAGRVNSIAFSPDSRFLLTGGEDKIARLYATANGKEEKQFVGHTGEITSVAYSPDGNQSLTGSLDKTARLWSIQKNIETKKNDFSSEVTKVDFTCSKKIFIASRDYNYVWDSMFIQKSWEKTSSFYFSGAVSIDPNEKKILAAHLYMPLVSVINTADQKSGFELVGKSSEVIAISISRDEQKVLSGGAFDSSGLWDLKRGGVNSSWWRNLKSKTNKPSLEESEYLAKYDLSFLVAATEFSPDGKWFVVGSIGGAGEFDTDSLKLTNLYAENEDIQAISFSPDGRSILTGSMDGEIKLWETETNTNLEKNKKKILRSFDGHKGGILATSFSSDARTIATTGDDKIVRLWNAETGEVKQIIKDFLTPVWSVAFSPDGKTIATASGGEVDMSKTGIGNAAQANSVQFWDVETGKEIGRFGGDLKIINNKIPGFKSVAFSPDGKFTAAGSLDDEVYLRNNETGELRQFEGHTDAVNSVKFTKDANGKLLVVSGSSDSTTRIWDAATGEEICALVTFRDGNWAVVQTKTGRYDAPNGGEISGIQWVFGNETIALNQLKDIYYTPNLLPRLLGYNQEPLRVVPELSKLKLFPKIVEQKLDQATAKLTVRLQNRGGGIGEVRILVNGKLAAEDARDAKLKADPNVSEASVTFNLTGSAGFDAKAANKIEVITNNYDAATKKGYVSSKGAEILYLGGEQTKVKQPNFYAIVGGVSDYNGSAIDLNFAAKDAEDFANALEIGARGLFCPPETPQCDKVKIKLLTTSSKEANVLPTKKNFEKAFAEIAKVAKPEDVLVVYLSGHGASLTVNERDTYFYLTQEADNGSKQALAIKEYRDAATISSDELLDWLTQTEWVAGQKGVQALKQVMILDTCAAGAFTDGKVSLQKTKDLSADQIRALERLKDRSGFQILMGSAADAYSYEANEYGQGILTYTLLQGMKGGKLRDGKFVDTQLLFGYAADEVPKIVSDLNGGIQKPRIFGTSGIDIGLLTDEDRENIKIESVKPVILRPNFVLAGETGADILNLTAEFRQLLKEASEAKPRSSGAGSVGAKIVFIDEDKYPEAFRITGTYTADDEGKIKLKAFIWTSLTTNKSLAEINAGDANDAAKQLLELVLQEIEK